jgi:hypothetical protein
VNISGSSVTDEVHILLYTLHFLGNRLRCLCSRCEIVTGLWIICIMYKNFHYIRKLSALCTCFMDNYDFCVCSRDIPFCRCDRISCLVACCGCIHCIAWSTQVMCLWFYSIFIILILFIYPDLYLISDIM